MKTYFVTPLYRAPLSQDIDLDELEAACLSIAEDDEAGQTWCEEHGYAGYTSYASLSDLPWRFPIFSTLKTALDHHVAAFADQLHFDLGGGLLVLEDVWINILPEGGMHPSHIHPLSVVSGTTYVAMPGDASAIKFEDPRHSMMMASPPRRNEAPEELQSFVYLKPIAGEVLLWESWLRHEVPLNMSEDDRISVSFNYKWV